MSLGKTVSRMVAAFAVFLLAASAFLGIAGTAWASEPYCVTCTAPNKVYQCQVDTGTDALAAGALQLFCIQQLAKSGGHDSCSVKRRGAVTCSELPTTLLYHRPAAFGQPGIGVLQPSGRQPGEIRTPSPRPIGPAAAATNIEGPSQSVADRPAASPPATATGPRQPDPTAAPQQPAEEPATLERLAKKTGSAIGDAAKKAGQGVAGAAKKAGQGIAGAAKKSWNCLTTLFSKC